MKAFKRAGPALTSLLIAIAGFIVLFIMLATAISPERYDIQAGAVSAITITATKDVEDAIETQKLRDAAAKYVQPSYTNDMSVQPIVLSELQACFDRLIRYKATTPVTDADVTRDMLTEAQTALEPVAGSDQALYALVRVDADTLSRLYEATYAYTREALGSMVAEGQEPEAVEKIADDLLANGFDEGLAELARLIVADTLRPNMLLDEATTEQNRQRARETVDPVIYKMGQNIVRSGEVVTLNQIEMLNSLGMLKDQNVDLTIYLGLGIVLFLLFFALYLYLRTFLRAYLQEPKSVALLLVIMILTVGMAMVTRMLNSYLMPITLGAMLTTVLIKPRLAILVNVALSILTALMASIDSNTFTSTMFSVLLISLISGTLIVPVLKRRPQRTSVLIAGLIVTAVNVVAALAMGLINSVNLQNVFSWSIWAGGSGLLSAVLAIGLQPALEYAFNLVTPSKLMELSNPNQPLLRRLLLEAPGTYHHSILVANLAEAAANAVGADGLLARVGAYYHDIGKLKRPLYFKENQINDNPHDRTDPRVSVAILTAHPRDGQEMAIKAHLPEAVQEIILQHHGDTASLFFYDKAVKQGTPVKVDDFRYDGPRPYSKEAAIVMLADTAEAAARAISESTPDKIAQMITRLVRSKMEDGQLDNCQLTFSDLHKICEAFLTVLIGVYHERVEYPNITLPERPLEIEIKPDGKPEKSGNRPKDKAEGKPDDQAEHQPDTVAERKPEPESLEKEESHAAGTVG